jgi:serine/threonine protein kinase
MRSKFAQPINQVVVCPLHVQEQNIQREVVCLRALHGHPCILIGFQRFLKFYQSLCVSVFLITARNLIFSSCWKSSEGIMQFQNVSFTHETGEAQYILIFDQGMMSLRMHLETNILPVPAQERFAQHILTWLHHMHSGCMLHHNLKPINMLLSLGPAGGLVLQIADFGSTAQVRHKHWKLGQKDGMPHRGCSMTLQCIRTTFAYTAPEITQNLQCFFESDVWSAGVVLFEMVLG